MEIVRDISQELKSSYIDYAMSVIVGRALPDVRDGLKPVQRRILYTMYEMGLFHNRPYKKCARIVGTCLGNYHPHGDAPVYEALVRLAQDFVMRYPLVDGQGNFGSIDGDSPAAMRYTEARLTRIAEEMLADIDKDTVDFTPNFDASLKEPTVLPSKVPNLLINGSIGIAVGMATNIPPHNLSEVCDAIKAYIKNPDISIEEIMSIIKGPDFPTGGIVDGTNLIKVYESGKGKITVKGRVEIEDGAIVIKEVPYTVNKAKLVEKIAELIKNGKLDEAKTVRDESDREGLRVVVELKGDPKSALDKLYKMTNLQITLNVIFLALVDGEPRILNIKELIEEFVKHRRNVVKRRLEYELKKSKDRLHILEGLKIAIENIDDVILLIKTSKNPEIAKKRLIEKYSLSEIQADAILKTRLQKLTSMEMESLIKEYDELTKRISELSEILKSPRKIDEIIIKEIDDIKKKFGDQRRTEIISFKEVEPYEEIKKDKPEIVVITDDRHVRKFNLSKILSSKTGILSSLSRKNVLTLDIHFPNEKMLLFSRKGKVYLISSDTARISSSSIKLNDIINLDPEDFIVSMISTTKFKEDILILTKDGFIKAINVSEFKNAKKSGILATLGEISAVKVLSGSEIGISTKHGYFIRFKVSDVPKYRRQAKGVRALKLRVDDEPAWLTCMTSDGYIVIVTENGYAKKVKKDEFRLTNRGSMGVVCIRGANVGNVVFGEFISRDSNLLIITEDGHFQVINTKDIPIADRNKIGAKIADKKIVKALILEKPKL